MSNAVEAYNLPQGIICHLFRAIANNGPGVLSKVGMGKLTLSNRTYRDLVA
jgi:propionate CoA-transferase